MEILLAIHVVIVVCLIGIILVQKSGSDGFTGSGGGDSMMSSRGKANFMTRATSILAILFLANSLALAYMSANTGEGSLLGESIFEESIIDGEEISPKEIEIKIDDAADKEGKKPSVPMAE